ncbi:hypothetical protein DVH24_026705 [Malus domestica]|uniref:Uncharacterized protein n=1 Tax=Malus domestica TaxID=3750 RepID=A0A498K8J6_MALDO|nr:hypothetical protein DVH24_026705 [Malus domestica]
MKILRQEFQTLGILRLVKDKEDMILVLYMKRVLKKERGSCQARIATMRHWDFSHNRYLNDKRRIRPSMKEVADVIIHRIGIVTSFIPAPESVNKVVVTSPNPN